MSTSPNRSFSHSEFQTSYFYDRWIGGTGWASVLGRLVFKLSGWAYARTFIRQVQLAATDRVLELGCGFGEILAASQLRVKSREIYVGLDLSHEMISRSKNRYPGAELLGKTLFLQGSALSVPLSGRFFDVVLLSHVIKYLTDIELALVLNEAKRVLRDGGKIVLWEFKPFIHFWISQFIVRKVRAQKLRSAEELRQSMETAGFRDLHDFRIVTPWVPWQNVALCGRL